MPLLDPKALLLDVISLISQDIDNIKRSITRGKLAPRTAADLRGYSKALLDIINELRDDEKESAGRLKGMSDEELLAKAQQAIDNMKDK